RSSERSASHWLSRVWSPRHSLASLEQYWLYAVVSDGPETSSPTRRWNLSRHSSRLLSLRIGRKSLRLIRRPANSIDRGCHLRSTQYRRESEEAWREASSIYVWR